MKNLRKSDNLKIQANKIFGGLIKNAFFEVDDEKNESFGDYYKEENNQKDIYYSTLDVETDKELRYDVDTIVFEFTNGAIVKFSNSEWAAMEKTSID